MEKATCRPGTVYTPPHCLVHFSAPCCSVLSQGKYRSFASAGSYNPQNLISNCRVWFSSYCFPLPEFKHFFFLFCFSGIWHAIPSTWHLCDSLSPAALYTSCLLHPCEHLPFLLLPSLSLCTFFSALRVSLRNMPNSACRS